MCTIQATNEFNWTICNIKCNIALIKTLLFDKKNTEWKQKYICLLNCDLGQDLKSRVLWFICY